MESVQAENQKLRQALDKAAEAGKIMAVRQYAEQRIANHPQAPRIRAVLSNANLNSKHEVDSILEDFRTPHIDPDTAQNVRARVRQSVGGGYSPEPIHEEVAVRPTRSTSNDPFSMLGTSMGDIKRLTGGFGDTVSPRVGTVNGQRSNRA
jgi:hypothetical protein